MREKLSLFDDKEIRKVYKNNKWYYSVHDVISIFANSSNPTQYLKNIKEKDLMLAKDWDKLCLLINMHTKDDKIRKVIATDTFGILRIIESVQSEKVEPIKRWLAKIGYERIEEISNPELLMDRMKKIYELKGYSKGWIEQREREITTRHSLKEEWKNRGIQENGDYVILTNEIYKSNFNLNIEEYKNNKGIHDEKLLKDSMTILELSLTNLSESIIIELHHKNNSHGMEMLKQDILEASSIINNTKKEIEIKLERGIISNENYNNLTHE